MPTKDSLSEIVGMVAALGAGFYGRPSAGSAGKPVALLHGGSI